MIKYAIHAHNDKIALASFTTNWSFSERETVFYHSNEGKRIFTVNHITHDVTVNGEHVVRLYCQEKKNVYSE